jgi:hypothetical protein
MRRRNIRRLKPTSGYIGSGNQTSVFARTSRIPFAKIKQIYGEELERLNSQENRIKSKSIQLTNAERLEIKKRLNKEFSTFRKKQFAVVFIAIITIAILLFWLNNLYFN